jgi:hypothetical protein
MNEDDNIYALIFEKDDPIFTLDCIFTYEEILKEKYIEKIKERYSITDYILDEIKKEMKYLFLCTECEYSFENFFIKIINLNYYKDSISNSKKKE